MEQEWEDIAKYFESKWNVFNTIGAMDGKHVRIISPRHGGSHHFNYKSFHSVILFAMVDANYNFIYVDAGTNGRVGDAGVFSKSTLKEKLNRNLLGIPAAKRLPNTNISTHYVILADDAFPLNKSIMKPYAQRDITVEQRIFNYRLSRGRRMVESAFGILANRFRVFLTTIHLSPPKVTDIILAACALHNLLTKRRRHLYTQREIHTLYDNESSQSYLQENTSGNEEVDHMIALARQHIRPTEDGREIRNAFKDFYNGPGKVPWQHKMI